MTAITSAFDGENYPNDEGWAADSDEVLTMLQTDGTASTIAAVLQVKNSAGNWRPYPDANATIADEWMFQSIGGAGLRLRVAITTVTGSYQFGRHGKVL